MTIVHKPLTFKHPETEDDPRVLEDAVLTLMVAATLGSGARTRARAETSSGRSRSVAPVPGWAQCGKLLLTCRHSEPEPATVSLSLCSVSQSSARVQGARSTVTLLSVGGKTISTVFFSNLKGEAAMNPSNSFVR